MIEVTLEQIAQITGGELHGNNTTVNSVSTDSRHIDSQGLFIALVGERFDAHEFIDEALAKKTGAVLVAHPIEQQVAQVVVKDTKLAMGQLAAWVHQQCDTKTLAITGSCGKTTVKEMCAAILEQKGSVLFTAGNFNNDIGVPLTLFRTTPEHDYSVIELGANHVGEIAYTTQLVKPSVAIVNNVAAAHLEGFGSIDGVKRAKGEIYQGLTADKVAIVNLDSQGEALWGDVLSDKHVLTFSANNEQADYYASNVIVNEDGYPSFLLHSPAGEQRVTLNLIGQHNVANALAAAALTAQFGATLKEIAHGLSHLAPVKGRVETVELNANVRLIDDSYNASVPAVKAAIELLGQFTGKRWLILGNMAELGQQSLELHRQLGEHAAPFNFDYILTYGDDARVISEECQGIHFDDHDTMIEYIRTELANSLTASQQKHTLLVKGANSAGMFKVAKALKERVL
ncbi:UDP-N-acetylmuramoyl-tripeptide--D-alanyl-D-alanine ligase [Vibrio astriarenae]|uniref:UDP-N-acetylmuramoyl-tripeptide--D-alanyl-D- alanine ligase n=1 Tax=Vibrio astriarenae TaxID=1481923 RepID=UPI003736F91A